MVFLVPKKKGYDVYSWDEFVDKTQQVFVRAILDNQNPWEEVVKFVMIGVKSR